MKTGPELSTFSHGLKSYPLLILCRVLSRQLKVLHLLWNNKLELVYC